MSGRLTKRVTIQDVNDEAVKCCVEVVKILDGVPGEAADRLRSQAEAFRLNLTWPEIAPKTFGSAINHLITAAYAKGRADVLAETYREQIGQVSA